MKQYILNKETQKIELHFEKSEYQALTEQQKNDLKSAYLWSNYGKCWVSRSKNNHYWAIKTAEKLGFTDGGSIGERLSYSEELEVKADKAKRRADRYDQYAENAEKRAENLQSEWNKNKQDWSYVTQPIIRGHAGSERFGRQRQKVLDRYHKGFEEYRKSEYFQDRAETARSTASMEQLKNPIYLHNRIKECKSTIAKLEKNVVYYEELLYKKENGEELTGFYADKTTEQIEKWLNDTLEKMEYEIDKQAFMENKLEEIEGNNFSKENIKPGYIVKMKRWGRCEILSAGSVNVTFKILDGGASGGVLTEPYQAIIEVIEEKEIKKTIENPYQIGDILCSYRPADNSIYKAYQVIKTTDTGVKLQRIAIENGKPVLGKFIEDKATQKKIVKSKWSEWIGVYMDDWQLHKYNEVV